VRRRPEPHSPLGDGFCFVDEHDGDIVLDLIKQPAPVADQPVLRVIETDLSLALGASQDIQEFLTDGHFSSFTGETLRLLRGFSLASERTPKQQFV
jgi:hypothetical protein